jgi:glycyl-tRNA synthetase beta chain
LPGEKGDGVSFGALTGVAAAGSAFAAAGGASTAGAAAAFAGLGSAGLALGNASRSFLATGGVMVDEPAVRANRLNLLGVLRNQAAVLADFSRISG